MKASVKYKVIYRHKDSYSISEMCRFFEVSRSGYYDFVNRLDTPAKDLPLDQMIQQCQEQCRNTYVMMDEDVQVQVSGRQLTFAW